MRGARDSVQAGTQTRWPDCVVSTSTSVRYILDSISEVSFLHPWLFTHYWTAFYDLVRAPVYWHNIWKDLVLQAGYVAVFGAAAWARMTSRDVLV